MSMSYIIKKNRLEFSSGQTVKFKCPIVEEVSFGDVVVVRLEIPIRAISNENVFGVSDKGQIIWQVPPEPREPKQSPFIKIRRDGDQVRLNNWDGMIYQLDPKTGQVIEKI